MQLELNQKPVKWIHEVARPHPILFFYEACLTNEEYSTFLKAYPQSEQTLNRIAVFREKTVGIDLLELEWNYIDVIGKSAFQALQEFDVWTFPRHKYMDVALEKWANFTERALVEEEKIYILDSSIFQYQIFSFILKNALYGELEQFIQKLMTIIKPLNPSLIYFYRENVEDTINFLEKLRGTQFMESIWERDKNEPYYSDKPKGVEAHRQFLRDYANIAKQLFIMADCRKTSVEITNQEWRTYENKMLSFFEMERKPNPHEFPPNGIYRNEVLDLEIEINGLSIKDPNGTERVLTSKSNCEFYIDCLPTVLCFNGLGQLTISGEQICERWTTSGTQFMRA
jgi:hypothetical protein